MKNIKQQIKTIVEGITNQEITESDNLLDQGILDSLLTIQLINDLENNFSISIPVEEFSHLNFNSIKAMSELIIKLQ